MVYAKIVDGSIAAYPFSPEQLRLAHPNTSFPAIITPALLAKFGVVEVLPTERPAAGPGQLVEEATPQLVGGTWQQAWSVRDMTEAEVKATVPFSVTPLQIRKALRQVGLKAAVDGYLATLPEEVAEEWEYALEVRRDNPTLLAAADALGMSEAQADDLFRLAASLT